MEDYKQEGKTMVEETKKEVKVIKRVNVLELSEKNMADKIAYHVGLHNKALEVVKAESLEIVMLRGAKREIAKLVEETKRISMTNVKKEAKAPQESLIVEEKRREK